MLGEQEWLLPPKTCFKVLECLTASQIVRLRGFALLPPDVDLVVLEEARPMSTRDLLLLACSDGGQVTQDNSDNTSALWASHAT